ncbi:MAG TPA: hypothetical protein VNQ56_05480 [Pseudolabrys sp.]|nr:hypothetical protein [Pseudolabrys sp.]
MGEFYDSETWLQILFITGIIGGGAAVLAGRAIAQTWRPYWQVVLYMLMLGAAVRFVHFALFETTLLSPLSYLADTAFLLLCASAAWRITLVGKMVRQYGWLYERAGLFRWRSRTNAPEGKPPLTARS